MTLIPSNKTLCLLKFCLQIFINSFIILSVTLEIMKQFLYSLPSDNTKILKNNIEIIIETKFVYTKFVDTK